MQRRDPASGDVFVALPRSLGFRNVLDLDSNTMVPGILFHLFSRMRAISMRLDLNGVPEAKLNPEKALTCDCACRPNRP